MATSALLTLPERRRAVEAKFDVKRAESIKNPATWRLLEMLKPRLEAAIIHAMANGCKLSDCSELFSLRLMWNLFSRFQTPLRA